MATLVSPRTAALGVAALLPSCVGRSSLAPVSDEQASAQVRIVSGPPDPAWRNDGVIAFVIEPPTAAAPRSVCALDGGAFAACASPFVVAGLSAGAHEVVVRLLDDGEALVSSARWSWRVGAGATDIGFGDDGRVVFDGAEDLIELNDVALLPDGRLLLVGVTADETVAAARLAADGVRDTSFGVAGLALVDVCPQPAELTRQGYRLRGLPLADGGALIAGACGPYPGTDLFVAKLDATGALASDFGGGAGAVILDNAGGGDRFGSVALLADGRILVAGTNQSGATRYTVIWWLLPDGAPDTAMGGGDGALRTSGRAEPGFAYLSHLHTFADGSFVTLLWSNCMVERYQANGAPDLAWGGGTGVAALAPLGDGSEVGCDGKPVILSDGALYRTGQIISPLPMDKEDLIAVAFTAAGALDTAFADGAGYRILSATAPALTDEENAHGLVPGPNGGLLLLGDINGYIISTAGTGVLFGLTAAGAVDSTFGVGGKITLGDGVIDLRPLAQVRQGDALLLVGHTAVDSVQRGFVIRLVVGE